jgi:transcription elongation factor Elf1
MKMNKVNKFKSNFNCPKCGYPMKVSTIAMTFKIPEKKRKLKT